MSKMKIDGGQIQVAGGNGGGAQAGVAVVRMVQVSVNGQKVTDDDW